MRRHTKRRRPIRAKFAQVSANIRNDEERRAIDEAFRGMHDDAEYQREAVAIAEEFAISDAEAMQIADRT